MNSEEYISFNSFTTLSPKCSKKGKQAIPQWIIKETQNYRTESQPTHYPVTQTCRNRENVLTWARLCCDSARSRQKLIQVFRFNTSYWAKHIVHFFYTSTSLQLLQFLLEFILSVYNRGARGKVWLQWHTDYRRKHTFVIYFVEWTWKIDIRLTKQIKFSSVF